MLYKQATTNTHMNQVLWLSRQFSHILITLTTLAIFALCAKTSRSHRQLGESEGQKTTKAKTPGPYNIRDGALRIEMGRDGKLHYVVKPAAVPQTGAATGASTTTDALTGQQTKTTGTTRAGEAMRSEGQENDTCTTGIASALEKALSERVLQSVDGLVKYPNGPDVHVAPPTTHNKTTSQHQIETPEGTPQETPGSSNQHVLSESYSSEESSSSSGDDRQSGDSTCSSDLSGSSPPDTDSKIVDNPSYQARASSSSSSSEQSYDIAQPGKPSIPTPAVPSEPVVAAKAEPIQELVPEHLQTNEEHLQTNEDVNVTVPVPVAAPAANTGTNLEHEEAVTALKDAIQQMQGRCDSQFNEGSPQHSARPQQIEKGFQLQVKEDDYKLCFKKLNRAFELKKTRKTYIFLNPKSPKESNNESKSTRNKQKLEFEINNKILELRTMRKLKAEFMHIYLQMKEILKVYDSKDSENTFPADQDWLVTLKRQVYKGIGDSKNVVWRRKIMKPVNSTTGEKKQIRKMLKYDAEEVEDFFMKKESDVLVQVFLNFLRNELDDITEKIQRYREKLNGKQCENPTHIRPGEDREAAYYESSQRLPENVEPMGRARRRRLHVRSEVKMIMEQSNSHDLTQN